MADIELKGVTEWARKMRALDASVQSKVVRSALRAAVAPTQAKISAKAPVGRKVHKTYKKNSVAPGHLSRSIRVITSVKSGVPKVSLGVKKTAFYGPAFLDKGITVNSRRVSTGTRAVRRGHLRSTFGKVRQVSAHVFRKGGRMKGQIKPYTLPGSNFYESVVKANVHGIIESFARELGVRVERALKRGR